MTRSICAQADPTGQIWQIVSAFRLVTLFFYRLPVSETTTSNEKAASRGNVLFEKQSLLSTESDDD